MYSYDYPHYRQEPSVWKKTGAALSKVLLKNGKDFCMETNMHGFNHIAEPRRHWFERLLWLSVTAVAIWGTVDISMGQLQRYNESPTVVTLEKNFRSWRYSLPGVTACTVNRVDSAKLPEVIKAYWNTEPTDDKYEYYSRFVNVVANSDIFHLKVYEEFKDDKELDVNLYQLSIDVMLDIQVKITVSEMMVIKWTPVMTDAGICFTTNSRAIYDIAIEKPNTNETDMLPITCKYSSQSCFIMLEIIFPTNFYFHSPYSVVDILESPSEVYLSLVRTTDLSVTETRCGRGVKELSPQRRGCLYPDEPTSTGRKIYSTNSCRLSCRSRAAMKLCGCIPFYYFYDAGPKCSPSGMYCLASHSHQLSGHGGDKCKCSPQCLNCAYKELTFVEQKWERGPFAARGSIKYAVQAPRTRYTREIVFHFQDLIVSFGGAAGLFLGASFISFVEIIYFILERLFSSVLKQENKPVKQVAQVEVQQIHIPYETIRIKELNSILENEKHYEHMENTNRSYSGKETKRERKSFYSLHKFKLK